MIEQHQIDLLVAYRDRSYVFASLCSSSYEFFSKLRSVMNLPLIVISSVMAILNSGQFEPEDMKLPNIIINSLTALILALISNFKLAEKETEFKKVSIQMTKICHRMEDSLHNHIRTITSDEITNYIKEYDSIVENLDYTFPYFLKERTKKLYKNNRTLPSILNCTTTEFLRANSTSFELNHIEPIHEIV
jgi:hypothetical protein